MQAIFTAIFTGSITASDRAKLQICYVSNFPTYIDSLSSPFLL